MPCYLFILNVHLVKLSRNKHKYYICNIFRQMAKRFTKSAVDFKKVAELVGEGHAKEVANLAVSFLGSYFENTRFSSECCFSSIIGVSKVSVGATLKQSKL